MKTEDNIVSTRSLWASAYLMLKGHKLVTFELLTPHNGHFIFQGSQEVKEDIAEYYGSSPTVSIREYLEKLNALRDLVMQVKREAQAGRKQIIRDRK